MFLFQETPFSFAELSSLGEAVAAVNRTVFSGLEGNLAGCTALSANSLEHLAGSSSLIAASCSLASVTAALAALGLVGEAFFCVKCLFIGGENEFYTAVLTSKSFVVVHLNTPNLKSVSALLRSTIDNYISTDLLCQ